MSMPPTPQLPVLDSRALRNAFGRYATGVVVVTTRNPSGEHTGVTVNSFTSVSLDPPLVLFCLLNKANSYATWERAAHFTMNILTEGQRAVSDAFTRPSSNPMAGIGHRSGDNGCAVLEGVAASLECSKFAQYPCGDHLIIVGRVTRIDSSDGPGPLLFHRGQYGVYRASGSDAPSHDGVPPALVFRVAGAPVPAQISTLVIAGWTGRDRAAVDHHIVELEALGVRPPREVPMFYRLAANLLTTANAIDVVGTDSSGEVECVLVALEGGLHVGIGSDHTDRKVEAYGVTVSKQVCPKPIGTELWRFDEVEGHWDQLILRSSVTRSGARTLYQEGPVTRMLPPRDLLGRFRGGPGGLPVGTAMFCGTLPVAGSIGGGELFEIELFDPVRGRSLTHRYTVRSLQIVD